MGANAPSRDDAWWWKPELQRVHRQAWTVAVAGDDLPRSAGWRRRRPSAGSALAGTTNVTPQMNFVAPSELPDYKPVFLNGFVRADLDGNVWIRTIPTKPIARRSGL